MDLRLRTVAELTGQALDGASGLMAPRAQRLNARVLTAQVGGKFLQLAVELPDARVLARVALLYALDLQLRMLAVRDDGREGFFERAAASNGLSVLGLA